MTHVLTCPQCGDGFTPKRGGKIQQKYCSRKCMARTGYTKRGLKGAYPGISGPTVGAIGELRVAADLLKSGYEVFRAVSPACSCDLAVLKDGVLKRIEVRTGYSLGNGKYFYTKGKKDVNRQDIFAICLPDRIVYEPPF